MKASWITDPHLDHLCGNGNPHKLEEFVNKVIMDEDPDCFFITGDIAEANTICDYLKDFSKYAGDRPIYFVLGNHDYYKGSIKEVNDAVSELSLLHSAGIHFLDTQGPMEYVVPRPGVMRKIGLAGNTGWCDARVGDPYGRRSKQLVMSDWAYIQDLRLHTGYELRDGDRWKIVNKCRELADTAAEHALEDLRRLAKDCEEVYFLTHFPPFLESCVHEGKISDDTWSPWFTSVAMGEILRTVAKEFQGVKFTVLCGHTHSRGVYHAEDNLVVYTGKSDYGHPQVSNTFILE